MQASQVIPIILRDIVCEGRESMYTMMSFYYCDRDSIVGSHKETDDLLINLGLITPRDQWTSNVTSRHTGLGATTWYGLARLSPDQRRIKERSVTALCAHDVDPDVVSLVESAVGLGDLITGLAMVSEVLGSSHPASPAVLREWRNASLSV